MIGFIVFLLSCATFLFRAFVFMKVWNWIPATIFSVPTIGFAGAIGLLMLIAFLREFNNRTRKENAERIKYMSDNERLSRPFNIAFAHGVVLLIAWIASLYV